MLVPIELIHKSEQVWSSLPSFPSFLSWKMRAFRQMLCIMPYLPQLLSHHSSHPRPTSLTLVLLPWLQQGLFPQGLQLGFSLP